MLSCLFNDSGTLELLSAVRVTQVPTRSPVVLPRSGIAESADHRGRYPQTMLQRGVRERHIITRRLHAFSLASTSVLSGL